MAEAAIIERERRPDTTVAELNAKLAREVEAVVEEAERTQSKDKPDTIHWFYKVPQAGVRYYAF